MENLFATVAYGTAVVGYDLLKDKPEARIGKARKISSLGLTGGGAAGDCAIELWVDNEKVGTYANTGTGDACDMQRDHKPLNTYVKAGALIQAKVIDAAPSGNMHIEIEFSSVGTGYRRTFRRRSYTGTRRTSSARRPAQRW